ncbi:MAG TPA: hypothetical protein VFZ65_06225 [Planctomycetota bacterium]|nr:hypothetical protein [Planctomycetota bacterium]
MPGRRVRWCAWLPALLLVAHVLLPGLHRWHHAVEHDEVVVCADCGAVHAPHGGEGRQPAAGHDHDGDHECTLCRLLLVPRDLLPCEPEVAAVRLAVQPRVHCLPAAVQLAAERNRQTPVRGPPLT